MTVTPIIDTIWYRFQIIIKIQSELGNKWTSIAAMLPGRTDNAVKNRWNSALRKRVEGVHEQPQQQGHRHHRRQSQQDDSGMPPAPLQQLQQQGAASASSLQSGGSVAATETAFLVQQQQAFNRMFGCLSDFATAAPPPCSTALVATTAPPFHLPMPLMTLQPHMSATEAAAALAAASCDVLTKVDLPQRPPCLILEEQEVPEVPTSPLVKLLFSIFSYPPVTHANRCRKMFPACTL